MIENRATLSHGASALSMTVIDPHQINDAAHVLSRAFYHDPLFQYLFPEDSTRKNLSFYTFKFIISHAYKKGFILSTSPSLEGIAVWLPSSSIHRNLIDQIRFGALTIYLKQGKEIINRQVSASEYMKSLHRSQLSVPHLYLSTIGIDETHRGKGLASSLIQPMLDKADREGLPCYLDTHNENNVGLYQRFGFRVAHESVIPDSNVRHWAMIRHNQ